VSQDNSAYQPQAVQPASGWRTPRWNFDFARWARRLPGAVAIAVCAYVIAYPFFVTRYPPITDLPFHAAATSILRHYFDPSWHFREQFTLHFLQAPYWTQHVLGALLALVLPMVWATKGAAIVMLAMLPIGMATLSWGMRKSPLLGLLGLPFVWNTLSHWGFLNFMGAIGLFGVVVGLTLRVLDRPSTRLQVLLAVSLVLLFSTHIFRFPFAVAAVVGTTVFMWPSTRRLRPVLLPLVPSLLLFGIWLVVRPKELTGPQAIPWALHWERFQEVEGFLYSAFLGPEERALARQAYLAVGVSAAIALVVAVVERRLFRRTRRQWYWLAGTSVLTLVLAAGFLLMFLSLPMQMGIWWYVYPREIVSCLFVGLAMFPDLSKRTWIRLLLLAPLAWVSGRQGFYVAQQFYAFNAVNNDFQTIVQRIPKAPRLGYMVFDHMGSNRSATPFIHLPAWVQAEKGGWLSFHFVEWNAWPIRYRKGSASVPPSTPLRFEWTPEIFDVSHRGKFFNWFLVRSRDCPDVRFRMDPTIHPVDHQGTWWLYKREGASP
jgi:hypothetical protein